MCFLCKNCPAILDRKETITYLTVLFKMAEKIANATVPPSNLRKFLAPVATAISSLFTLA
jgi:hypothetical protein